MTLIGSLVLLRIFSILSSALSYTFPVVDSADVILATPFATGGILLQVTLGASSVFIYVLSFGLLTGLFLENTWLLLPLVVVGTPLPP